ncbi:MAG TPA: NADH-ubiquinone oxidoreductase-F iron-sulfur binding region domain-containing protein, partial [Desulfuromonadaceae bacterium]
MAEVVFSTWGGNTVDNRNVSGEPQAVSYRLPVAFDGQRPLRAFMGWDGIILFDKDVDVPAMTAEYIKRVQTLYCCGRCTPGKKGTKVLMDLFQNVLAGKASEMDLDKVGDLAELLKNCKCTLCQSATVPVFDAVKHFRADFQAYLNPVCRPKVPAARYIHKITAPCMDKCPAHIDIPKYVEEIKNYQYSEALA